MDDLRKENENNVDDSISFESKADKKTAVDWISNLFSKGPKVDPEEYRAASVTEKEKR